MTKGPILFDLDETEAAPGPDAAPPVPDPEMPEAPEGREAPEAREAPEGLRRDGVHLE